MGSLREKFDELVAERARRFSELMEGTGTAIAGVNRDMRPLVRSWFSEVLLSAELGKPLQTYLQQLPKGWRDETELLLDIVQPAPKPENEEGHVWIGEPHPVPWLLPVEGASRDPRLSKLTALSNPTNNQWLAWLDSFEEAAGMGMRPPFEFRKFNWAAAIFKAVGVAGFAVTAAVWLRRD